MPNPHARPQLPLPRKRKERDHPDEPATGAAPPTQPDGNRLLAGYLAHEFLTKGTLLGRRFEPVKDSNPNGPAMASAAAVDAYADVAALLKAEEGAHVPGVVNPTHLARWMMQAAVAPSRQ